MSLVQGNYPQTPQQQWHFELLAREVVVNWHAWGPLQRAEAILRIRKYGVSLRKLAASIHCSESLIRHYEILANLPWQWKQALDYGQYSARQLVAMVRDARRAAATRQRQRQVTN